jgi:hypothetical protein
MSIGKETHTDNCPFDKALATETGTSDFSFDHYTNAFPLDTYFAQDAYVDEGSLDKPAFTESSLDETPAEEVHAGG